MIRINSKKDKDFKKFNKNIINNKKKINFLEIIQKEIQKIINICEKSPVDSPLEGIDYEEIIPIIDQIMEILTGFKEYELENTKKDYENVKNIVLVILYFYSEEFNKYFLIFINNYKKLLKSIINLEYIDQIKIMISFIIKTLGNIKEVDYNKIVTYNWLNLINLDDEESYKKFPYVKKAFDIFYFIIDNLTEDSPFFQSILQFNSRIYYKVLSKENMHSGSILNLYDRKIRVSQKYK